MIGYFSDQPGSQGFPSQDLEGAYPSAGNFIVVVGLEQYRDFSTRFHERMEADAGIPVFLINFPVPYTLGGLSDHRNFWAFGYPALMINDTAFLRNPHYHMPTDTIETLDFDRMTEVVSSACRGIIQFD